MTEELQKKVDRAIKLLQSNCSHTSKQSKKQALEVKSFE